MKKLVALAVALFCVPATAALAAAGGATRAGYSGEAGHVQGAIQKAGTASGNGTLPFTGLSLTVVVVVGALLIVTGLLMRRRHRPNS